MGLGRHSWRGEVRLPCDVSFRFAFAVFIWFHAGGLLFGNAIFSSAEELFLSRAEFSNGLHGGPGRSASSFSSASRSISRAAKRLRMCPDLRSFPVNDGSAMADDGK